MQPKDIFLLEIKPPTTTQAKFTEVVCAPQTGMHNTSNKTHFYPQVATIFQNAD